VLVIVRVRVAHAPYSSRSRSHVLILKEYYRKNIKEYISFRYSVEIMFYIVLEDF